MTTTLHIKNMVCSRCIRVVRDELEALGLHVIRVALGGATISGESLNMRQIQQRLQANGFEILESATAKIVERIKTLIIELVHSDELTEMHDNLSDMIVNAIGRDYTSLSHLFSSVEAITIERFFILQKIERAKELLTYGELSASEIAYKLGYSSPAHLSRQFKQTTGFTPREFKTAWATVQRIPLDEIGGQNSSSVRGS